MSMTVTGGTLPGRRKAAARKQTVARAELAAGAGRIGIEHATGGARSVEARVARWQAAGVRAVVSVLEAHELERLDGTALPAVARACGIAWHTLPVAEGTLPGPAWALAWHQVGTMLRTGLRRGARIEVMGGADDRAALVAARLAVELGAPPMEAIARVRQAIPEAIGSRAKEAWVTRQSWQSAARDARAARELAVLLGGALGDALGYRVEFDDLDTIRARYGDAGITLDPVTGPLVVSDDTQMTLFTLEGMTRAGAGNGDEESASWVSALRAAYQDWYGTQQPTGRLPVGWLAHWPVMQAARAPGNTCLAALADGGHGTPEVPVNDSKGCGAVMRVAPLGFLPAPIGDRMLARLARASAAITHGHADGQVPAVVMAVLVRALLDGQDWSPALMRTFAALEGEAETAATLAALNAALTWVAGELPIGVLGAGWTGEEALAMGLAAAMRAGSFEEAIELAANHDGDSDSTASIAGQIYGARHGLEALPGAAIERLDVREALLDTHEGWVMSAAEVG